MTSSTAERSDDELIAAEYVLGVLPQAERAEFAQRLQAEPQLRSHVAYWEGKLTPLLEDVAPVAPPARLLGSLERRLFPESASPASHGLGLRFWQSVAAALFLALIAITTAYVADWRPGGSRSTAYVAELNSEAGRLKLLTYYDPRTGILRLNRLTGEPPPGRSFELWLLVGNNAPVSLGVLPEQVIGSVSLPVELRKAAALGTLAVSDEPAGGSPSGQPTGDIVAAAKLNSV